MITSPMAHALRVLCALALTSLPLEAAPTHPDAVSAGEAIYRLGRLPSGQPLIAERDGVRTEGAAAACVNCHRRSGLGSAERRRYVPPVTGQFLFHPKAEKVEDLDLPFVEGSRPNSDPYTEESLARAIRAGIGADGHPLGYLMPRFALDDAAMAELIAYLKKMTVKSVPGVSESALQFATIITPDADPAKREAVLSVLKDFFAEKNANARSVTPPLITNRLHNFRVTRRWYLHVWELTGSADTWDAQLRRDLAAQPVFAVISSVGGKNWEPVQSFCENAKLPCLFPNVELPVVAEDDYYTLYFFKGVLLEAELIAHQIQVPSGPSSADRLVQVYRESDVGVVAAKALKAAARHAGIEVADRVLKPGPAGSALAAILNDVRPGDGVVLWLRPEDLAALGGKQPKSATFWISGLMGGLENAPLPAAWRRGTRMAYPFDLPDKRRVRVDYPLGWFRIHHIPVTDLPAQVDTYLACGLLSESLNHMADTFVRDYLIERIEGMLEHRAITGYYPRLSLAQGQRFASKGGYIVRFAAPAGPKLVADGGWIVP